MEGLATVAPQAEQRGVKILVEALPLDQANVVNTLAEAASIVHQIGSPAIQTMFDTHNAVDEVESHATLVERYFDIIATSTSMKWMAAIPAKAITTLNLYCEP